MAASHFLLLALLALQGSMLIVFASDPTPLQDFCIADNSSTVFVNGIACKDPKLAKAEDFFFSGLNKPGKPSNPLAPGVVTVQIPGLNTLGISMARLDFGPSVENALHYHPRATEILTVLEGTLDAGFIASDGHLFTKVLNKGDVFVFPQGTIHYQLNRASTNAVALAALSSQNPGVISIPSTVFGSEPSISVAVLAKAFQLDTRTVKRLQGIF